MAMFPSGTKQDVPSYNMGAGVDLSNYSTSNKYVAEHNGYVFIDNTSGTSDVTFKSGPLDMTIPAGTQGGIFMRKGISMWINGSPRAAKFFPDLNE